MTEHLHQFDFSEDSIKETNHYMLFVFLPVLIIFIIGFSVFITGFKIKETLICSFITILITGAIWAIEIPLIKRSQRKIKAFIDNDKIIKQCGNHENYILWDDIARIKIRENNKSEITHIHISGKNKITLWLSGLNDMGKLAVLIRERISGNVPVITKRNRLDQRILGIISAVIMMLIMTIIASLGHKAMDIFAIFFTFGVAVFLLLYRPLAKIDARNKWVEIIMSLFLILMVVYGFISFLYTGRLP